jgi:dTDP-4-dehydrorhamnose reductase
MKVLIMGGSGMLGHKLWQQFAARFDTSITFRGSLEYYRKCTLFDSDRALDHVSAEDFDGVVRVIDRLKPDVIVNCIGIVKQAESANDPITSISVNALFPHRLAKLCRSLGIRLIQISTDCVFSGRKGYYNEEDKSDAEDLYGRTKYLGELTYEGCLTLRTSIIGRELVTANGLIEWFLSQDGLTVKGYTNAIFSGFTTICMAEIIGMIITGQPDMSGVWHVASQPISKYDLISLVKQIFKLNIHIERDDTVVIDRSLNAGRFLNTTGFIVPSWRDMIEQMYLDPTPYVDIRRSIAKG